MSLYDDVLASIETALRRIRTTNGFRTNAGLLVWKNLEYETAPPDLPCVIYYPGQVSDTVEGEVPPSQGEENHYLPIKIDGVIRDTERGDKAEALRQDILAALKADPYFGGLTEGFSEGMTSSSRIEPAAEASDRDNAGEGGFLGFVEVNATIFYVTTYGGEY